MTNSFPNRIARCSLVLCVLGCVISLALSRADTQVGSTPKARSASARDRSSGPGAIRAEFEAIAERLTSGANRFLGRARAPAVERRLQSPGLGQADRVGLLALLAQERLKQGEIDGALEATQQAMALIDMQAPTSEAAELYRLRGLVHLRQAELQNCILRHDADSCILPLRGSGIHVRREPALAARRDFERALEIEPGELRSRWLLNVVYMALGRYPKQAPVAYRIPPSVFASEAPMVRFRDIAPRLGLDRFDLAGGAILEDFDEDGLLDVVSSTYDPHGSLAYYRNLGDGRFEDRSAAAGLDAQLGGLNCLAADYDNDGRRDLLVLRGAWLLGEGKIRNSLLRNRPNGTFVDVTRRAGLAVPARPTQAAAWGDFDNDGDLDLYVCNEASGELVPGGDEHPSQLFRNDGNGTFTDVAARAGVTNDRYCKGVAAGDYDNDGDFDLYVSNAGPNRLYRNDGGLKFSDVAAQARVTEPTTRSFASWFFDVDNDGWLDLFVAGYRAVVADVVADLLGQPSRGERPRLFRNNRDGTFSDVTAQFRLDRVFLPMGANFGDLDNDGYLDIYLGTGEPDYRALVPNVMLRNDRGRRFQDVTADGGFGHLQKGHGVAFGDLDNDGDQDIFHQLGGFYRGDKFQNALFHNPGRGRRFVIVELIGTRTNRDGIGARIKVVTTEGQRRAEFHRAVGSVSSFGGSPIRQEIGLGNARAIERIEIVWPASGSRTVLSDVPLDGALRVVEGREGFEALELRRIDLLAD